jgi:hypothetical protein
MSDVFQTIDPPPPHRPASVYSRAFGAGGKTYSLGGKGGGRVNSLEDVKTLDWPLIQYNPSTT